MTLLSPSRSIASSKEAIINQNITTLHTVSLINQTTLPVDNYPIIVSAPRHTYQHASTQPFHSNPIRCGRHPRLDRFRGTSPKSRSRIHTYSFILSSPNPFTCIHPSFYLVPPGLTPSFTYLPVPPSSSLYDSLGDPEPNQTVFSPSSYRSTAYLRLQQPIVDFFLSNGCLDIQSCNCLCAVLADLPSATKIGNHLPLRNYQLSFFRISRQSCHSFTCERQLTFCVRQGPLLTPSSYRIHLPSLRPSWQYTFKQASTSLIRISNLRRRKRLILIALVTIARLQSM